jgi:hypothetical protein
MFVPLNYFIKWIMSNLIQEQIPIVIARCRLAGRRRLAVEHIPPPPAQIFFLCRTHPPIIRPLVPQLKLYYTVFFEGEGVDMSKHISLLLGKHIVHEGVFAEFLREGESISAMSFHAGYLAVAINSAHGSRVDFFRVELP